jgi:hypothetical protein
MNGVPDNDRDFAVKLQRRRKLSPEQIADMMRRYQAGESMAVIAEDLGVVPSAVHYQLSKRVVLRPNGRGTHRRRPRQGGDA